MKRVKVMGDLVHVSSYLHLGINQVRITIQLVDVSFACDVEICEFPKKKSCILCA